MPIVDESQVRAASAFNARLNESVSPAFRKSRQKLTLDEILAEIQRIADLPMDSATTLPSGAYTSDDYFAWEMDNLFRAEWSAVAHISQLPEPGDFINVEWLGEPLIIIRDKSNDVHVLSRICPHRGMDIMPPGFGHDGHGPAEYREGGKDRGHSRLLLCPYHSWTFELDGQLKACPEMQEASGFQRCEWGLKEYRSEVWNGFIFVNIEGNAEHTVAERLQEMSEYTEPWDMGNMKVVFESHWDIPCN